MLENNNYKICRRLVRREFQFHRGRSILLMAAIVLVSMLCTFSFAIGHMIRKGTLYGYMRTYGSTCHIVFYGADSAQAAAISRHNAVKETASVRAAGVLSDDMMEYRSVRLAPVSTAWAEVTESVPVNGRMPEAADEIALDELTLQSLAVPRRQGERVTLKWTPVDGGPERTDTFTLCGWWNSAMSATESCAWITQEAAQNLYPEGTDDVTLGVILYRPGDPDRQAQEILDDVGAAGVSYTTSLAWNDVWIARAGMKSSSFYRINIIVAVCGALMIYNIMRISAGQNMRFYGRVKSLGMSPGQIRRMLLLQAGYLCLPAVPAGWILGFTLYVLVAPAVMNDTGGYNPAFLFWGPAPFVWSGLLTWMTVIAACALPARFMAKIRPAQAMRFTYGKAKRREHGKAGRKKRRRTDPVRLVLNGFGRGAGGFVLSLFSILAALIFLCSLWTMYRSADEDKYLAEFAFSDYLIADASATTRVQRYNPNSCSITPDFLAVLAAQEAVTGLGTIRTVEIPMYAAEEERALIVENFEGRTADGIIRKEVMAGEPDWCSGYEKFRRSGEYIGIAAGIDGIALSAILEEGEYAEGIYDAGKFAGGNYVIASGASTAEFVSTPPLGSRVEIGGQTFEIMAAVSYPSRMVTGSDSREAQFNVSYYMPAHIFEKLFPACGVRNVMVDIDPAGQDDFEIFIKELTEGTGIGVTMRSDYQWDFGNALFHNYIIPMYVGVALLFIGILNFINAMVTAMLARGRELAVYESLGMTRRQIRTLLLWEGLLHGGVLSFVLVPAVSAVTWLWGRWWMVYGSSAWCATWCYSLVPLWIALPALAAVSAVVPLLCFRPLMAGNVTQRLRVTE